MQKTNTLTDSQIKWLTNSLARFRDYIVENKTCTTDLNFELGPNARGVTRQVEHFLGDDALLAPEVLDNGRRAPSLVYNYHREGHAMEMYMAGIQHADESAPIDAGFKEFVLGLSSTPSLSAQTHIRWLKHLRTPTSQKFKFSTTNERDITLIVLAAEPQQQMWQPNLGVFQDDEIDTSNNANIATSELASPVSTSVHGTDPIHTRYVELLESYPLPAPDRPDKQLWTKARSLEIHRKLMDRVPGTAVQLAPGDVWRVPSCRVTLFSDFTLPLSYIIVDSPADI